MGIANNVNNDGVVTRESAMFLGHTLMRPPVECIGLDHFEMRDGPSNKLCANGLALFDSIALELPTVEWISPPPLVMTSGTQYVVSWRIVGNDTPGSSDIRWDTDEPADSLRCVAGSSPACLTQAVAQGGGVFSSVVTAPAANKTSYLKYRASVATTIGARIWSDSLVRTIQPVAGPILSVPPAGLSFSSVTVTSFRDLPISVKNLGDATLTGSATTSSPFSVVSGGSFSLASGESKNVVVRFAPTTVNSFGASLLITSNAGNQAPSLTGTGIPDATPSLPAVVSNSALSVTQTGASLSGSVTPNGSAAVGWFDWGTTSAYGSRTPAVDVGSSGNNIPLSYALDALAPGQTYHFRATAQNPVGTKGGADQTFTTSAPAPGPTICHTGNVDFSSPQGVVVPTAQTANIWNCGGGTLNFSVQVQASWISFSPTSGSSTGGVVPVTVSVDPRGLPPGNYADVLTVSAPGATNTPQIVPVYLHVNPAAPAQDSRPFAYPFTQGDTGYHVESTASGTVYVSGGSSIQGAAKYDSFGNLIWAHLLDSGSAAKFALDSSEDLYFTYQNHRS